MNKINVFVFFLFSFVINFSKEKKCNNKTKEFISISNDINCRIIVTIENKEFIKPNKTYLNNSDYFYEFDSINISNGKDTVNLFIDTPKHVTLFINNDAENSFQFYLCEGKYELYVDAKNKVAKVVGSSLNDEYLEMMRVHDSMFKQYKIMHAILYPYNGMERDSAHEWIRKYLPLCDSISAIHINNFYETHLSSFLTLEYIHGILEYTFDNPGYDTIEYDTKRLKVLFNKLDSTLRKYKMYDECIEMFNKERVKLTEPPKSLWKYENKN